MADWQGRETKGETYPPMLKMRRAIPWVIGAAVAGFAYVLLTGKGKDGIVPTVANVAPNDKEVNDQGLYQSKQEGQSKNAPFDHIQRWK
eukprot:jgi/Botrbrau1/380/Bobra.110_2s0035.1